MVFSTNYFYMIDLLILWKTIIFLKPVLGLMLSEGREGRENNLNTEHY
jgi:hypothetical protein